MTEMTSFEAIGKMWAIADKPERMRTFHKIVMELGLQDGEVFWHEFWRIWETSENLNEDVEFFPELIEHGLKIGDPHSAAEDDEKEAFAALPDLITIYRGCIEINQEGWSWTTDRDKARWFAERAYGETERLVLVGKARKSDVLAYLMGRNESEIVIDPENVIDIEVDEIFEHEGSPNAGLFYAIQSGKFGGGAEMDRTRAEMMASTFRGDLSGTIKDIEKQLEFVRWADLKSKRGYFEALVEVLQKKLDDPSYEPLAGFQM